MKMESFQSQCEAALLRLHEEGLKRSDGAPVFQFPTHNGPHLDEETPVRSSAHWLYIYCWLTTRGHQEFHEHARTCLDYLRSSDARPMAHAFFCRRNPYKDYSNGLVGQAWVIEALLYAYHSLGEKDGLELAVELFEQHKWEEAESAWRTLHVDGSYGPVHPTFNQQLWFAAMAAQFPDNEQALKMARDHLSSVEKRMFLYPDGVIFHDSPSHSGSRNRPYPALKALTENFRRNKSLSRQRTRSVGYHSFNLVALTYLKNRLPEHSFWKSGTYNKVIKACETDSYCADLNSNRFGHTYNPVGWELLFAQIPSESSKHYQHQQLKFLKDLADNREPQTELDSHLARARSYELCRAIP